MHSSKFLFFGCLCFAAYTIASGHPHSMRQEINVTEGETFTLYCTRTEWEVMLQGGQQLLVANCSFEIGQCQNRDINNFVADVGRSYEDAVRRDPRPNLFTFLQVLHVKKQLTGVSCNRNFWGIHVKGREEFAHQIAHSKPFIVGMSVGAAVLALVLVLVLILCCRRRARRSAAPGAVVIIQDEKKFNKEAELICAILSPAELKKQLECDLPPEYTTLPPSYSQALGIEKQIGSKIH